MVNWAVYSLIFTNFLGVDNFISSYLTKPCMSEYNAKCSQGKATNSGTQDHPARHSFSESFLIAETCKHLYMGIGV